MIGKAPSQKKSFFFFPTSKIFSVHVNAMCVRMSVCVYVCVSMYTCESVRLCFYHEEDFFFYGPYLVGVAATVFLSPL